MRVEAPSDHCPKLRREIRPPLRHTNRGKKAERETRLWSPTDDSENKAPGVAWDLFLRNCTCRILQPSSILQNAYDRTTNYIPATNFHHQVVGHFSVGEQRRQDGEHVALSNHSFILSFSATVPLRSALVSLSPLSHSSTIFRNHFSSRDLHVIPPRCLCNFGPCSCL